MIITTNLVPSRKAAFVMPTSLCLTSATASTTHRGGAWAGVRAELTGEVSVMTAAADRGRTVVFADTDQLVPGTSAWSPPT
jgi:hypothetical protein